MEYKLDFTEFQNNIYNSFFEKDKHRDYYLNVIWYLEEILELLIEIYDISNFKENIEKNNNKLEKLLIELSDVLAWLFSILNLNDIKIYEVFIIPNKIDNIDSLVYKLIYANLYFIKSIKKKDIKNLKNSAYLIISYLIKISNLFKIDIDKIFSRYETCPRCSRKKCIC